MPPRVSGTPSKCRRRHLYDRWKERRRNRETKIHMTHLDHYGTQLRLDRQARPSTVTMEEARGASIRDPRRRPRARQRGHPGGPGWLYQQPLRCKMHWTWRPRARCRSWESRRRWRRKRRRRRRRSQRRLPRLRWAQSPRRKQLRSVQRQNRNHLHRSCHRRNVRPQRLRQLPKRRLREMHLRPFAHLPKRPHLWSRIHRETPLALPLL